ncbi:MAG: ATP-dependent DNA ligase [Steroidobacteraceae bacterium]
METSLADLVAASARVGASAARRTKVRELAGFLRNLADAEIDIAVGYLSGDLPQGKIGIGGSMLRAAAAAQGAQNASLALAAVDRVLSELAATRGSGSQARREAMLQDLFGRATAAERDFLFRLLVGELRQGALAGVMIDAIAAAADLPAALVRRAAMYSGALGAVARAAILQGADGLAGFQMQLFSPIAPMLAQTAADTDEALHELAGKVCFEAKMDGARIQVHKQGLDVRVYTRGLNEVSAAVPEIVEMVRGFAPHTTVLDGEAITLDAAGRPHPFQITMRRFGRKGPAAALLDTLPLGAFFFDCLRLEEQTLIDLPTHARYAALDIAVPHGRRMPHLITADPAAALRFYEQTLDSGHEGVMAKSLEAAYEAGNRGASWLKIKRVHTLDLVVLAAEWGHGRRTGRLSNLHLGALEPATGDYIMLGKTFKGLTDQLLEWQTSALLARETRRDSHTVYVRPDLVVEVAFSDLQASTRYPGGFALRLARIKRYRDDKQATDADTMDSVRRIDRAQRTASVSQATSTAN